MKLRPLAEAITPEERKKYTDFAKILKEKLTHHLKMNVAVQTLKSNSPNPYIQVFVPDWKVDVIPNDFRLKVINIVFPDAKLLDKNDVSYGNIQTNKISLKYSAWKKVYDGVFATATTKQIPTEFSVGEKALYVDKHDNQHIVSVESAIPGKNEYIILYNSIRLKVSGDELTKIQVPVNTDEPKTENINELDNSLYVKPDNLQRIGWLTINKRKNDGRPLYKLYDEDDPSWGATWRMGTGKYPEDHKLFYTIPIKIENEVGKKFRIMGEDEKWSRPYSFDDYMVRK